MKKIISALIISLGFVGLAAVYAAEDSVPEISFPVKELGGCESKEECFTYCELPENGEACLDFAKKHQLLSEEEIMVAEKVQSVKGGPGGCKNKDACENYCDDVKNIEECISFAEENGLMQGEELEEAKKIRKVIQNGGKLPGGCKNKESCEKYCEDTAHMEECLAFAEQAGFISGEELEQAKKFMPLMKKGETPGGCKSKDECEAYCESDENFEECINFAEKHGMIPEEERANIEAFKKSGGKGPGGCKGRQCQTFCENPDNQETCFNWAKENGMMKEEDLRRMEEGRQQIEKMLNEAPTEVRTCIEQTLGSEKLEKMRSGGFFGGEDIGEKIRACFEKFMPKMGGEGEFRGEGDYNGGNFTGPGGCKGPEECMTYCKNNPEECQKFSPPQGERNEERRNDGDERRQFEGGRFPPGDNMRREGEQEKLRERPEFRPEGGGEFRPEFQKGNTEGYNQEYRERYEAEQRQQYEQQYQEQRDQQYQQNPEQQFQQPSENDYPSDSSGGEYHEELPPSESPTSSQSKAPSVDLLGLVLAPFLELFK